MVKFESDYFDYQGYQGSITIRYFDGYSLLKLYHHRQLVLEQRFESRAKFCYRSNRRSFLFYGLISIVLTRFDCSSNSKSINYTMTPTPRLVNIPSIGNLKYYSEDRQVFKYNDKVEVLDREGKVVWSRPFRYHILQFNGNCMIIKLDSNRDEASHLVVNLDSWKEAYIYMRDYVPSTSDSTDQYLVFIDDHDHQCLAVYPKDNPQEEHLYYFEEIYPYTEDDDIIVKPVACFDNKVIIEYLCEGISPVSSFIIYLQEDVRPIENKEQLTDLHDKNIDFLIKLSSELTDDKLLSLIMRLAIADMIEDRDFWSSHIDR